METHLPHPHLQVVASFYAFLQGQELHGSFLAFSAVERINLSLFFFLFMFCFALLLCGQFRF